ncbi:MAG: GntG family PLP-dependent aldolase [Bacteroidota bacterium]
MKIDLRSDTVTLPTSEMLESMMQAEVGDDVYDEDPTVNALQEKAAEMFGMEAGLFCPSGTMCNQIAIRVSTKPQDHLICDQYAHVHLYEGGGIAYNSMVSSTLVAGDRMRMTPQQIREAIYPDDVHYPQTRLVCLENSCNKGGGSYYTLKQIKEIAQLCEDYELKLHLDGARVFNALVASGDDATGYGECFDTISVCLSKGLGAPVGSVLLGSEETILAAKRVRKVLGGGMRQAGYLAAAGVYALDHHIERLEEDHARARMIGGVLSSQAWVKDVMPVDTNIICFKPQKAAMAIPKVLAYLKEHDIHASRFGKEYIRMVTHLDIADEMALKVCEVVAAYPGS